MPRSNSRTGQAAPLERDATHPLAQPHAGAAQASTGTRRGDRPCGSCAVGRTAGKIRTHLNYFGRTVIGLHHNGRARASAQRRRRKRHPSHQSPHQGRIHLLATKRTRLLRGLPVRQRNCLPVAMTPVGVTRDREVVGMQPSKTARKTRLTHSTRGPGRPKARPGPVPTESATRCDEEFQPQLETSEKDARSRRWCSWNQ